MVSMTGWTRERLRLMRMSWLGEPAARDMAVSAPMEPALGPVMTTRVKERLRS